MSTESRSGFPFVSTGIVVAVLAAAFCSEFALGSYARFTDLLRLHTQPYFVDLGVLLDGLALFRDGKSPYESPTSPFNYPPSWQFFAVLPFLNQANLFVLGFALIAAFYAFSLWFLQKFGCPQWAASIFLVSPPVLLLLERGNCDIVVYLIVGLGAVFLRSEAGVVGAVFAASMLKLFPVGAMTIWLRGLQGRLLASWWKILLIGAIFAIGFLLQFEGLKAVSERTPRPLHFMSYGLATLPALVAERTNLTGIGSAALYVGFYASIAAFGGALWMFAGRKDFRMPATSEQSKNLFVAGAGCFLVSNLIGFNWEYRLVFLLLTLPEIFALRSTKRTLFFVTLVNMVLLFYQTLIKRLLDDVMPMLPYNSNHFYFAADLSNIVMFCIMMVLTGKIVLADQDGSTASQALQHKQVCQ